MKKCFVMLILLIVDILLYTNKTKLSSIDNIDLNLKQGEIALTILSLEKSKSILLNRNDLFVISYEDSTNINDILNLYEIRTLDTQILNGHFNTDIKSYNKQTLYNSLILNDLKLIKKNNIVSIDYYNYSFCIYKSGDNKDLKNCDFIYFLDIDDIDYSDDVLAVFFDKNINTNIIEKYYDKWVDSYILNNRNLYTIKMSWNDYEVVQIQIN